MVLPATFIAVSDIEAETCAIRIVSRMMLPLMDISSSQADIGIVEKWQWIGSEAAGMSGREILDFSESFVFPNYVVIEVTQSRASWVT